MREVQAASGEISSPNYWHNRMQHVASRRLSMKVLALNRRLGDMGMFVLC